MSVRWRAADAEIFADWTSLIRLARTGAGWPSAPSDGWAHDAHGLRGANRDLRAVLGRVPTGRIVILGEPGSGKTVLLVRLLLDLLEHRTADQPVPVLLSLASWNPAEQALRHWIEQRLIADHIALAAPAQDGRAKSLAGALLEADLILPVLDGLDDPTQGHRWSPVGVVYGLVTGAVAGLAVSTIAGPQMGLLIGGAAALAGGLAGGWLLRVAATDLIKASGPQTVLRRDRTAFFTSFLGLGLAVGLGNGLQVAVGTNLKGSVNGPWAGIETGLINLVVGLAFGFLQACWGSFSLARWWLAASLRLPWRLMTFLADAHTNRGVLRQVGAVYQFRHVDLQRRLAGDR